MTGKVIEKLRLATPAGGETRTYAVHVTVLAFSTEYDTPGVSDNDNVLPESLQGVRSVYVPENEMVNAEPMPV